jgi:hypothetical protein
VSRPERVILPDRQVLTPDGAILPAGAGDDNRRPPGDPPDRLEKIDGAGGVDLQRPPGLLHRDDRAALCGQMKDAVWRELLQQSRKAFRVPDVAELEGRAGGRVAWLEIDPQHAAAPVRTVSGEVAPDEARGTGYEDVHVSDGFCGRRAAPRPSTTAPSGSVA